MTGFFRTTIGKKYLMGLSGLVWAGFIFGHMAGNMLILVSPDAYNAYGNAIVSNKLLLFGTEAILLAALFIHVLTAFRLTIQNKKAKGKHWALKPNGAKRLSFASSSMVIHGSIILVFIITHLITFKYGTHYETEVNGVVMRDLARLITEVFSQPLAVAWYVVSLLLLFAHLSHGFGSVFQSFGLLHPGYQRGIHIASWAYAIIVTAGFLSQPLYVFLTR